MNAEHLIVASFWISVAVIVYTYLGYPILLWLIAKIYNISTSNEKSNKSSANTSNTSEPCVAILIVAHNETEKIAAKITSCLEQDYPTEKLRIVIVSDGSTDSTVSVIRSLKNSRVNLIEVSEQRGKAACLNDAIKVISESVVVMNDSRQILHPAAVSNLVRHFDDPKVGAVSGELIFRLDDASTFGGTIDLYWKYEKAIRKLEARIDSTVGVTGAIYAMRRELYQEIPTTTVLDDLLIPMNIVMQGYRVLFDKEAIAYDKPSQDLETEKQRKVRTLAGNFQIMSSHPRILNPVKNRILIQLVSHKVLRLMIPAALTVAYIASLILSLNHKYFFVVFIIQTIFYCSPIIRELAPTTNKLKIIRIANTFISMNWFVVLAFHRYITQPNLHIWKMR